MARGKRRRAAGGRAGRPLPPAEAGGSRPAPGAPAPRHRTGGWLLAIAGLALVLRGVLLWQLHAHPLLQPGSGLDIDLYVELARRVAAGDLVLAPGAYPAAPLYIYVLGAVFAASGGSLLAARALQIVLGALAVWLIGDAARRLFGERAALPAALLAAFAGPIAFNEILVLQSSLDPVLTAAALSMLARHRRHPSVAGWLAAGVLWAAFALNRPNALPFAVAVTAGVVLVFGMRRGLRAGVSYLLGLLLLLAPVAIRNLAVTGDLVLVASHGGFNFFVGNNAEADGTYRSVEGVTPSSVRQAADARRVAEHAIGRPLSDGEVSDYFYARAFEWIASAPGDAAALLLRKIRYVLSADEISLNYSYAYYRHDERTVLTMLPVGAWLLLPVGLAGLLLSAPQGDRGYWIWFAFVPVYAISVAVFFVSDRYRLPLLVPLATSAGAVLAQLAALVTAGAWRALGLRAAAIAAVAALAWWPTGLDSGRSEERTAMAETLLRHGEIPRGQALVERARPDHPQPALLLFRAGRALQAAGQLDPAMERYQQALALEPGRPEIRYFLGQALLDRRRVAEAIPHLDAAVTAGVRLDTAPFDLARALAATGDREGARRALARLEIPSAADLASLATAGQLAEALGDAPLAIRFYAQGAQRADAPVPMLERLGVLLAMSDRPGEAIEVLTRATVRRPGEASLHLNLAVALAQAGRFEDARVQVREALRLRPDYPQAKALRERLQ